MLKKINFEDKAIISIIEKYYNKEVLNNILNKKYFLSNFFITKEFQNT